MRPLGAVLAFARAAAPALALSLLVACTPAAERADQAREALARALARGDRAAALEAVQDLRSALPESEQGLLEVAQRLVQAGSAPDAAWLLEEGIRRYPACDDLRVALGRVALKLGNPSQALEALAPVVQGSEDHAAALVA